MQCPTCKSEAPPAPSICPHCGAFISVIPQAAGDPRDTRRWAIRIVFFITVLIICGVALFNLVKQNGGWRALQRFSQRTAPRPHIPVVHGNVIHPNELQHRGTLYFIPMGRQAISAESLAKYYDKKFEINIAVLQPVPLDPSACLPERKQCVAEEMVLAAKRAYPKIAADPDAVLFILTDEDLYSRMLGWDFTYSYHHPRFAVVSTHRMAPSFWGDPPSDDVMLANTHQLLTDHIAEIYFHVPRSFDPTSVMFWPLTPNGGRDDLFESDLHSEESANGRDGDGWPCLSFTYSYDTGKITPWPRFVNDCYEDLSPRSTHEETFQVELAYGQLVQRSLDLKLDSSPPIDLRRSYLSRYLEPMAFGRGANHKYNTWLISDGPSKLSFIDIVHEDGIRNHLQRVSSGVGFSSKVVFEDRDDAFELYGARMTWDKDHFKLLARDGSWWTYLPCISDSRCFWIGFEEANHNTLRFERDNHLALQRLLASDGQGLNFTSDPQARIVEAKDSRGNSVSYEYDAAGCLSRVRRSDGREEVYSYDAGHHMIAVAVSARSGEQPRNILKTDYDSAGRAVRQVLPDGSTYGMEYLDVRSNRVHEVKVTDPAGRTLDVVISKRDYTASMKPVRFPALRAATRTLQSDKR
jgi:YD repeat-containing protein